MVALTRIGGKQTALVSLYLDIKQAIQPQWLNDLLQMITNKKFPIIMGINSNAHSTLYGPDNNAKGGHF